MALRREVAWAQPYLLLESDPAFRKAINRGKSIKVLTKKRSWRILKSTINRKDDRMAKDKKQKGYMRTGSIALLTVAACNGITEFLGGGLRDAVVATMLAGLLFALATDFKD